MISTYPLTLCTFFLAYFVTIKKDNIIKFVNLKKYQLIG